MKRAIWIILALTGMTGITTILAPVPAAHAFGGSALCLEEYNLESGPFGCLNAWGGGPEVKLYNQISTNNNQFGIIFASGSWGSAYAIQYQGGGKFNGWCIGDYGDDPSHDYTGLVGCPSSTYSGGWGSHFGAGTSGCYTDNGGGQSGFWHNSHWNDYLGNEGNFSNGAQWYLLTPFQSNPDYTCFYGEIT